MHIKIFSIWLSFLLYDVALSQEQIKILHQWIPPNCERKVESGDSVRYHYYGMFEDGKHFDSSYMRGRTYNTRVGSGMLIQGMDDALLGMCLNEHRIVSIPPDLAYGDEGTDGIPGGATLLFNFVLLDISNEDDTVQIKTTYMPENCERKLKDTDFVRYRYNGTLLNGEEFHSSYDEERTYDTYVGQGWLIRGMDIGLIGSCMKERRTITIPSHLAYGVKGDDKNIPPAATIRFDVEIVDFHNPDDEAVVVTLSQKFGSADGSEDAVTCPRKVEDTDFVRYHYNASFADGTKFASSHDNNHTYDTYVGFRRLIAGMERGILGTCVGEHRKITIPPHLGYGEPGIEGTIPGSAVLIFDIYLVDVHNPKDEVKVEVIRDPPTDCERKAAKDDYLTYDYELELMDGTKIDSSKNREGTWATYNGRGRVILGLQNMLTGMCVGEIRKGVVPPHLGFGEPGADGIPGSAVLVYTVELHKIEDSLPNGMLFMWKEGKSEPENLFSLIDDDANGKVSIDELMSYIVKEVDAGNGKLLPGAEKEKTIENLFKVMDKDEDGFLQEKELEFPTPQFEGIIGEKVDDEL
ncbi:peptidyl-prolyl cis-trans isomerase FKBP9-like isoform X2 [Styela clava]